MTDAWQIAIETSGPAGEVALGRGDAMVEVRKLATKRRHNLELMPTVAAVCADHGVEQGALAACHVCIGPGSFTGLRAGIAVAQMLSLVRPSVRLTAVPALDAIAAGLEDVEQATAILLSRKRGVAWAKVVAGGDVLAPAGLHKIDALLDEAPRPLAVVADVELELNHADVTQLPVETAWPGASAVYHLGRASDAVPAAELLPLYAREPEAVTLWQQRHGKP